MLEIVNEIVDIISKEAFIVGGQWSLTVEDSTRVKDLWGSLKKEDLEIAWWMIDQRLPRDGRLRTIARQ